MKRYCPTFSGCDVGVTSSLISAAVNNNKRIVPVCVILLHRLHQILERHLCAYFSGGMASRTASDSCLAVGNRPLNSAGNLG